MDIVKTRKRMLVLEELASEMSQAEVAPDDSSVGSDGERPKRPESSASRTFRSTARMVSKAKLATKSNKAFKEEEFQPITKSLLYQLVKPLFVIMAINGIFFYKTKEIHTTGLLTRLFGPKRWGPGQIYCVTLCGILLVNALRSLLSFEATDGFTHVLFFKMLWVLKWYHAFSTCLLFSGICWPRKKGSLSDFFFKMQKVCYPDKIIPYEQSLYKALGPISVLFTLYVAVNVAIPAYAFFGPANGENLFRALLAPGSSSMPYSAVWKGVILFIVFICMSLVSLTMIFYFVMCYILYKEMEYFGRTFCMKIRSDGMFIDDLEKFRIMHQKRCKLVEEADTLFKKYIANHYLVTVVLVCLLLFNIVYMEKSDQFLLLVASAYLVFVAFEMIFVSLVATAVNTQSHAPLAYIHSIKAYIQSPEDQLVMNMFMNRLTGTQIGMTAWDMFIINKPAILTVGGFILTYFFLMVQLTVPVLGEVKCICRFFTMANVFNEEYSYVMDVGGFILTYFFLMVQLKTPVLGEVKCLCRFFSLDAVFIQEHDFVMDLSI